MRGRGAGGIDGSVGLIVGPVVVGLDSTLVAIAASARRDEPGPVADEIRLVEDKTEQTAEFLLWSEGLSVFDVIATREEPPAVHRIREVSLRFAREFPLRNGEDLAGSAARRRLRRPDAHFPLFVEDETRRASEEKDLEFVDVLIEFDAAIKRVTVFRIAEISLPPTTVMRFGGIASVKTFLDSSEFKEKQHKMKSRLALSGISCYS